MPKVTEKRKAVPEVTPVTPEVTKGEVTLPQMISDPSGTVDEARPTADFFPEIKPTTELPVGTELRVTIKPVGEKQTSFWARVESRDAKSNIYTRLNKEGQQITKETPKGTEIAGDLVFHGAIVKEQLARENVLLGELQTVKLRKPVAIHKAEPSMPKAVTEAVGNLNKGAWVQFKPAGIMYQITEIGKTRATIVDGEGNRSTIPLRQAVYPLETKPSSRRIKHSITRRPTIRITPKTPRLRR